MSSPAVDIRRDLPPGLNFVPTEKQLIKIYLLPRVRGQADPFPGLVIEDDSAANTQPWELFSRHGQPHDVPAFFYVRTNDARAGARPDRRCHGGGSWKSQRREREDANHELLVGGEKIKWSRHNLNLNMGSGSIGWVMHEYTITECPSLKICRISFTGHGKKRNRVPDAYDDCLVGESATQRPRLADESASATSASGSTTAAFVQDFDAAQSSADNHDPLQLLSEEEITDDSALAASASWTTTTTSSHQEYSSTAQTSQDQEPFQHVVDVGEITAMVAEMTHEDGQPFLVPMMEERADQEPAMADGESYLDLLLEIDMLQSDMAAGTEDVVTWGDFSFV